MTNDVDYVQTYLNEVARQTGDMTLLVTITVGIVALIFAIGAFLVWRENRSIIKEAHAQVNFVQAKSKEIDSWYNEKQKSIDEYLNEELNHFNIQINEMRCYQTLVMSLTNTNQHAALIFPALCPLAERPCALYVGVFKEIIRLNISQDITQRAEMGLQKWQEIQDQKAISTNSK